MVPDDLAKLNFSPPPCQPKRCAIYRRKVLSIWFYGSPMCETPQSLDRNLRNRTTISARFLIKFYTLIKSISNFYNIISLIFCALYVVKCMRSNGTFSSMAVYFLDSFQCFSRIPRNCWYRIPCCRTFFITTVSYKENLTVEVLPDVHSLLKSGELKHRKHPGIRKIIPVRLPEVLKLSVEKIISEQNETVFLKEAENLCRHLSHRRLPVENHEIEGKIQSLAPEFDGDFTNLSKIISKQQLKELKKSINLEAGRWKPIEYNYHTCLAYLVGRLAPNYASVNHIFDELKKKAPTFKPQSYFDFGSGVGSSLWAANTHWSDSIKEYFCIDTSADMIDVCGNLITDQITEEKLIYPVFFRQFLPASESVKYDLVVSAFSLLELQNVAERLKVIDALWRKTKQFLVIVEYGTVAGFHCVLDARDFILQVENDPSPEFPVYSSGAHVVSPCPHDFPCPKFMEKTNSSCGFTVPYYPQFPRKYSQVIKKDWISYVIIRKCPRPDDYENFPRIVKPVLQRTKHVICHLCCSDGKLKEVIITKGKHGRHTYRCARASNQGDILPVTLKPVGMSSNTE